MKLSMYQASVPVYIRMLTNLIAILEKAAEHAQAKNIEPAVLINARLFPDMFPLSRQVQIASDHAKGSAARLAGAEPPRYEDNEKTFAELTARLRKTIDYLKAFRPEQIDGSEDRAIELQLRGTRITLQGIAYLLHLALPNFYFHVSTAYNILRHNGVPIGKQEFLGKA